MLKLHANLERWDDGGEKLRKDARCPGTVRRLYVRVEVPKRRYVHVGWVCDGCARMGQREGAILELGDRPTVEDFG